MYTNAQKLAAVLAKWVEPIVVQMGAGKLMGIPALAAIQNKIRSTGWVSPSWSMVAELSPIISKVGGKVLEPIIEGYLKIYPDKDLPSLAHSIVDAAIEQGKLEILEGNICFDSSDLQGLKRLLNYNLSVDSAQSYEVRTEPNEDGGVCPS